MTNEAPFLHALKRCISKGNFTNHGPAITACENRLETLSDANYYVAIYGSSFIGTSVAVWLAGGLQKYTGDYDPHSMKQLLLLMQNMPQNPPQPLVIRKSLSPSRLKSHLKSNFSVLVVNQLNGCPNHSDFHTALDYSILFFQNKNLYKQAVSMRSSYGINENQTDVIATLNGRPSELIGEALLEVLKT